MNDRQSQIVEAAIKLFLTEGVGVSTASIAKAAGVSNGTLFNAFPTKQDLIDAMYLTAKLGMFDALALKENAKFDRSTVAENWGRYLTWARRLPHHRQVMHLLHEAGLISDVARARVDALGAPQGALIEQALNTRMITGPNVEFIVRLIFFHIDLVIDQHLEREDETLAFEMLCNSIGLNK